MTRASTALHVPLPKIQLSRLGDERLAALVGGGRDRAFAALYDRYHQQLYRYCRSMLRNDADAQDALQSTFAAALSALQRNQRNAPLRPWLFRIAHNESISLIRRRREDALEPSDEWLGPAPSAHEEAEKRARLQMLVSDLAQLPERQRSALLMRELSGLSHAEIGVALGTSLGAAKQAIFDARTTLGELAEGRAMSCDDVMRTISDRDGRAMRGRRIRAHMRDCTACSAFATSIEERRGDLRAFTPVLAAPASAALFGRLVGSAGTHAGGSGSAGVAAGVAGKLGTAAISTKALVAAAIVAGAAGVGGLVRVLPHHSASAPALTAPASSGAKSGGSTSKSSAKHASRAAGARAASARAHGRAGAGGASSRKTGSGAAARGHGAGAANSSYGLSVAGAHSGGASSHASGSHAGGTGTGASHSQAGTRTTPIHPIHPSTPTITHPVPTPRPVSPPLPPSAQSSSGTATTGDLASPPHRH